MNYKLKSLLIIFVFVAITAMVGFFIGGGITGAGIAHSVACFENADCDDKISNTEDTCKNPGTEYALCTNKPIEK